MRKVNYHLTERQIAGLKALNRRTGLPVAELIRRAIDALLDTCKSEDDRRNEEK